MIDVRYCRWCGKEVEDKAEPSMDGKQQPRWVHYPGGYSICFPQQSGSPRAEPEERTVPEATEDPTKRRHLVAVARLNLADEPDLVHLSVLKWWPMVEAWATGMTLCGRSASQGALPADTAVTCQDCEGLRDSYERTLEGRPTVEQERLAAGEALAAAVLVVANQLTQAGIHDAAELLGNAIDLYEEAPR